jgi:Glycosyltransferase family 87
MTVNWKALAATLLSLGLASLLWVRGIAPAVSRVDTDFPNYLTAARIVADGGPAARLYDDAWFQEQMRHYGIGDPQQGKFAPFPPPTALLLLPLSRLQPLSALRVLTGVSLVCLVCSILLLARTLSWSLAEATAFVLLSGYAVGNTLRFGQPYILMSALCLLGYFAWCRGRPWLAGLCFGLFVPIKYFPGVILIYFAFRREWPLVLGGAAAAGAVVLVSLAVLGWPVHQQYLGSVLGNHLVAHLSMQDPFAASFQSFDTLFRRLFVFDAAENPHPWRTLPWLQQLAAPLTKIVILAVAAVTLVRLARDNTRDSVAPSIGLLGVLVLLLAPATATYHFVLLWLPVALLISFFLRSNALLPAGIVLGTYALIGFFPYGRTVSFEGRGGLTVLAYPRLFLMLALFSVCVYYFWSHEQQTRSPAHIGV